MKKTPKWRNSSSTRWSVRARAWMRMQLMPFSVLHPQAMMGLFLCRFGRSFTRDRVSASTALAFLFAWAVAVSTLPGSVQAQETYDPVDRVYATGAIFETEEELAGRPRTATFRNFLPEQVDLSDGFPTADNQGRVGSCTAWAVGYAARSYYNNTPDSGPGLTPNEIASPAYIYDATRPRDPCAQGTRISVALDLLKEGVLDHAEYRYYDDVCRRRPGPDVVARASKFRIADWFLVDTDRLDQVKAELANGHPVIIAMQPNRDFHRLRGTRIWRAGYPDEKDRFYHAIVVVGYSERGQYFTVMNSWGTGWGMRGFGRMSYDTFEKRVRRGFSMRIVQEPPPEPPPPPPEPPVPPSPDPPVPPKPPRPTPVVLKSSCRKLAADVWKSKRATERPSSRASSASRTILRRSGRWRSSPRPGWRWRSGPGRSARR